MSRRGKPTAVKIANIPKNLTAIVYLHTIPCKTNDAANSFLPPLFCHTHIQMIKSVTATINRRFIYCDTKTDMSAIITIPTIICHKLVNAADANADKT